MTPEQAIGEKIAWLRKDREMSQAQLGEALGLYLGKPWSRQSVHAAEKGQRAFTAAELVALALALDTSVPSLFLTFETDPITLPSGQEVDRAAYQKLAFHPSDLRGRTSKESWDSLRRIFEAIRGFSELHKRMGAEIDHGLEIMAIAIDARKAFEEYEAKREAALADEEGEGE